MPLVTRLRALPFTALDATDSWLSSEYLRLAVRSAQEGIKDPLIKVRGSDDMLLIWCYGERDGD